MEVVLLPGFHGTGELFAEFVRFAPAWASCRPVTLPAHGSQDFASLADRLGPEIAGAEILVAESYSASIAALASRVCRPRLLVLCNPLLSRRWIPFPLLGAAGLRIPLLPTLIISTLLTNERFRLAQAVRKAVLDLPSATLVSRLWAVGQVSAGAFCPASVPTLTILAENDRVLCHRKSAALLAEWGYPPAMLVPGPHLILQSAPSRVWEIIGDRAERAS